MPVRVTRHPDGEVYIKATGTFDEEAAAEVVAACAEARHTDSVSLDMHGVTLFRDSAFSRVAPVLAHGRVKVCGVGRRHAELLRYFGCHAEEICEDADDAPDRAPELPR